MSLKADVLSSSGKRSGTADLAEKIFTVDKMLMGIIRIVTIQTIILIILPPDIVV